MSGIHVVTRFPPSFLDSPWSYGYALFSLALSCSITTAMLIGYALEARRAREARQMVGSTLVVYPDGAYSPIVIYRMILSGFLLAINFGALPDVIVLLAWGEASDATMTWLFRIDRAGDGAVIWFVLFSAGLTLRTRQGLNHELTLRGVRLTLRPNRLVIRENAKIVALVLLIAIGVTAYKSSGLR